MKDDTSMRDAIAAVWERSRETILERVATLEHAAVALRSATLSEEGRRNAEREAHKLAGAVGTFGFPDASALARTVEELLHGTTPLAGVDIMRIANIVARLRRQLEHGRPGGPTPISISQETETVPSTNARLLVVVDDETLVRRLSTEARTLGIDVTGVTHLAEARAAVARGVDLVLLDLTIQGAGLEFLEELYRARPTLPVLVVSDGEQLVDRVEAARLGGRGFLQKPVVPSQVIDLLRDLLVSAQPTPATIVCVDDDPDLLTLMVALLQPLGARVVTATDPLRVLSILMEHSPDLVILDVDMPELDGIELCRVLRNDPRWAAVPILFLTGKTEPTTVIRMFECGADDFVAKPVLGPELLARVRNRLERTRMLRLVADVDSLTGVATRRRGIEALERFFRLAQRHLQPLSVAVIDLDRFKRVNDRYGHQAGDAVLRRAAAILSGCFRGEDIVARWGGEEFIVGMYSMPLNAATRRLGMALDSMRNERFDGFPDLTVTFSAGVAEYPLNGSDWTTLYRVADDALVRAKSEGRNRVLAAE